MKTKVENLVVLVVDIGSNMSFANDDVSESHFAKTIDAVNWVLSRRIIEESTDEYAIVLFGGDDVKTENPLQHFGDAYANIWLHDELQSVSAIGWEMVKFFANDIKISSGRGDWLSALIVAADVLSFEHETANDDVAKEIYLFSNLGGRASIDGGQYETFMKALRNSAITGPNMPTNVPIPSSELSQSAGGSQPPMKMERPKTVDMLDGEMLATQMLATESERAHQCYSFSNALAFLQHFKSRQKRSTAWKCAMALGVDISISIVMYAKVVENKGNLKFETRDATDNNKVKMMRGFESTDAPIDAVVVKDEQEPSTSNAVKVEVDDEADDDRGDAMKMRKIVHKEDTVNAYKYGASLVSCNKEDMASMKYRSEGKCFQILKFTQTNQIRRHYLVAESNSTAVRYVFPDALDTDAAIAFSALVQAMIESDRVAIVRYVYSAASGPKIGALFPKRSQKGPDMMIFIQLPFYEDIRDFYFDFQPFPESTKPDVYQLEAVDQLIDAMDLTTAKINAETGERSELLRLRDVINPHLQATYEHLRFAVINNRKPNADEMDAIKELAMRRHMTPAPELVDKAADAVQLIRQRFPLEAVDEAKKTKKRASTTDDDNKTMTASKRKSHADSIDDGAVASADNGNASATSDNTNHAAGANIPTEVGSIDPTGDLKKILDADPQHYHKAVQGFINQVNAFIDSFDNEFLFAGFFAKTVDCLIMLRSVAIQHAEPKSFNEYLRDLKRRWTIDDQPQFWQRLLDANIRLIIDSECAISTVSQAESDTFQTPISANIQPAVEQKPIDDDEDDDLACLE